MTSRRPKGDGSIYRTRGGRWRGSVEVVRADGSRGRKYLSGRNKSEVAKQVRAALRAGGALNPRTTPADHPIILGPVMRVRATDIERWPDRPAAA